MSKVPDLQLILKNLGGSFVSQQVANFKNKMNLPHPTSIPIIHTLKINNSTQPQNFQGGESKSGEWGLIKVKKQVDFKIGFRRFKAFLDHVFFSLREVGGWVRTLNGKFHYFFLNHP